MSKSGKLNEYDILELLYMRLSTDEHEIADMVFKHMKNNERDLSYSFDPLNHFPPNNRKKITPTLNKLKRMVVSYKNLMLLQVDERNIVIACLPSSDKLKIL